MRMVGQKTRSFAKSNEPSCESIRRITKEKIVVRGNETIRTIDTTTSFLPGIER